jgi:hypothetical protein
MPFMSHLQKIGAATLTALTLFVTTMAASNSAAANATDQHTQTPLVSITSPSYLTTVTADAQIDVAFSEEAIASSFTASINGKDVTDYFSPSGRCARTAACPLHGIIPQTDLLPGINIVMVDVNGPNASAGTARTQLVYEPPATTGTETSHMIPSVAIKSVNLPQNANRLDYRSYQIVLGPGPAFSPVIYSAADLTCSAGLNSMQVLVLERQELHPDTAVGDGSGRACLGDARSLTTFLKSIPTGDLVIVNSFQGLMSELNTTDMGGTNFTTGSIQPHGYTAIGVAGARAGTAYESYRTASNAGGLVPLVGSLNLDIKQHYFFTPSDFVGVKVKPEGLQTRVQIGDHLYPYPLPAGARGAFVILTLDRHTGGLLDNYLLRTNDASPEVSRREISELTYLLDVTYSNPDQLQLIYTEGPAFASKTAVPAALISAINRRGGNGYLLPKLTASNSSYTLIGSSDPNYIKGGYVLETSTAQGVVNTTGEVDGLLARDKTNRFVLGSGVGGGLTGQPVGYQWTQVVFGQPRDWPAWTPAQQAMYADLTAPNGRYPYIRGRMGCSAQCQPIRSYYGGGIGGTGTAPAVADLDYGNITYQANEQYSQADFNSVTQQLTSEAAYLKHVYSLYSLFVRVTIDQGTTLQSALATVATNIDSGLAKDHGTSGVKVSRLAGAASVANLLALIPGAGAPFGAVSAVLTATANLVPLADGVPDTSQYVFTLADLRNKTGEIGTQMGDSIDQMFTGIVSDWGKLSIIGSGYAAQQAPWYLSTTLRGSNVPRAAMPAIALGAKRMFYTQLLPTLYSTDVFYGRKVDTGKTLVENVKKIGGVELIGQGGKYFSVCTAKYANAPAAGVWAEANATIPTNDDIFIITRTERGKTNAGYYVLSFPSTSLLDAMFATPQLDGISDPTIAGGAGLLKSQFGTNYSNLRAGYIPDNKPCTP